MLAPPSLFCTPALCSTHQLLKVDPRRSTYLACGLFLRGDIMISDVQRNIERIKKDINMAYWNEEGFKVGLCAVPPVSQVRWSCLRRAVGGDAGVVAVSQVCVCDEPCGGVGGGRSW